MDQCSGLGQKSHQFPNFQMATEARKSKLKLDQRYLMAKMLSSGLESRPDEKFCYTNANYVALNLVIEAVSGNGYEDFVASRVFKPLGISACLFNEKVFDDNSLVSCVFDNPARTAPSVREKNWGKEVPISYGGIDYSLFGIWCLSSSDQAKLTDAMAGRGTAFFKKTTLNEVSKAPPCFRLGDIGSPARYYGLGWNVISHRGGATIELEHLGEMSGAVVGARTRWDGYTISFVFNSANGEYDMGVKLLTALNEMVDQATKDLMHN